MNYQKIYNQIIDKAKSKKRKKLKIKDLNYQCFEAHHIIPRCMGGEGKSYDHNHPNIVLLTAREHFICHWLLHRMYPENIGLSHAFWRFCNNNVGNFICSSRVYEEAKIAQSKSVSMRHKGKKGTQHSLETINSTATKISKGYIKVYKNGMYVDTFRSKNAVEKYFKFRHIEDFIFNGRVHKDGLTFIYYQKDGSVIDSSAYKKPKRIMSEVSKENLRIKNKGIANIKNQVKIVKINPNDFSIVKIYDSISLAKNEGASKCCESANSNFKYKSQKHYWKYFKDLTEDEIKNNYINR